MSIKMNNGLVVFDNLKRMLKVFLSLEPEQEYVRSLVHQMLTLIYWRKQRNKLPFWKLFTEDVGKFNEEPIELSFSLLGRSLVNDGMRTDIAHVRDKYKDVKNYVTFKKEFQKEFLDKDTMKSVSGRFHIKEGNTKLAQVKAWLMDTINKCRYNSYRVYTDDLAFKSITEGLEHSVNLKDADIESPRLYLPSCIEEMERLKEKHREVIECDWGKKVWGEVWDEFKEEVMHESDAEEDEDEDNAPVRYGRLVKRTRKKVIATASSGKDEVVQESEMDGSSEEEEKMPRRRQVKKKHQVDFTNRLAEADTQVNEEFERLKENWMRDNPGGRLQGGAYYRMSDQARSNVAMGETNTHKRGRGVGFYNEQQGSETDVRAALHASRAMMEEEVELVD
jgi:hypothetical protein